MIRPMPLKLSAILSMTAAIFKDRADLVAENMALRHQLSCLIHRGRRPKIRPVDRVIWVLLSRFWNGWRKSLAMVKPATVLAWYQKGEEAKLSSGSSGGGRVESAVWADPEFPSKFVG